MELTMSPIQVGKLFGSTLFEDVSSVAGATGIVSRVGTKRVKLGVVDVEGRSSSVDKPQEYSAPQQDARLRLDEPQNVMPPLPGAQFRR